MNYGLRIALNGCFDLLHNAHIKLLHRAMFYAQGGHVLVLLDSDNRVKELKGEGRPIDCLSERAANILKVLYCWNTQHIHDLQVNYQIDVFESTEDLQNKLDIFKPDMIIKGNDWTDVSKITGFPKWPILIVPRGLDDNGNDISTTSILGSGGKYD